MYRIGIDVGGTFTDVTLLNSENGQCYTYKLSSTPYDQSVAILNGAKEAMELYGVKPEEIHYFGHGTTVATNMIIERKGARTALITTKGFGDLLEIGRQTRPSLYNLQDDKPEPLVIRSLRLEADERIDSKGAVLAPLRKEEVMAILAKLKKENVESIAVCFLFSYLNSEHEKMVEECIHEIWPEIYYSTSSEIIPEFREFERLSTTVINSYLGPKMKQYIDNLRKRVKEAGIKVEPYITQSNGGVMSINSTIKVPVQTALSGPSAGVVGAIHIAKPAGFNNLITYDMGGTSTDVSLVCNGIAEYTTKRKVCGLPSGIPMIDVHAVGAGGGSIAYIDNAGALKVGPESSGATPGPACYNRGGTRPAVTDANLVLGRLNPGYVLGGRMELKSELAYDVIEKNVAEPMGLTVEQAAQGIISVVNSNMARAIRVITVERGFNPSDFTLVAYGGAGPLHAVELAKDMGIHSVLIPSHPGTLCALGLLAADIRKSYVRTDIRNYADVTADQLNVIYRQLMTEGTEWLASEEVTEDRRSFHNIVEMRYIGQNYELQIPVPARELTAADIEALKPAFFAEHEKNYGYFNPNAPIQLVNYRSEAIGKVPKPELSQLEKFSENLDDCLVSKRQVYFDGYGRVETPVYQREKMGRIEKVAGPCIVEQMDSTLVIPPETVFDVDAFGNIIVTL